MGAGKSGHCGITHQQNADKPPSRIPALWVMFWTTTPSATQMIAATFGNVHRMLQTRPERGWRDRGRPKTNLIQPTKRIEHHLNTLVKKFCKEFPNYGWFSKSPARWLRQRRLRSSGLRRVVYRAKYNGVS